MSSFTLRRHAFAQRGVLDHAPPPLTWDYANPGMGPHARDLAFVTCSNGHTTRLTAAVHVIAHDGTVSPSYVCPVPDCGFHAYLRLVGFSSEERWRR